MSRVIAIGALAVATVAVFLLLSGGSTYRINARFVDAGQLVKGGTVQVGGRTVGTISAIQLSDDGLANVELSIDDDALTPLRRGTVARVRAVGLTGVANRFVELTPGPSTGEEIPDRGLLTTAETRGIVDLDVLFNAFDPATRGRLQRIIRNGEQVFKGRTAAANDGLQYLAPALFQSSELAEELVYDRVAIERLLRSGATTAAALASRRDDITQGITSTATTLRAIASQREQLASILDRAPALLNRPGGVLGGVRDIANRARPLLREARPVAPGLVRVLRELVPTSRQARPVLEQTRALLPPLTDGLNGLPELRATSVPALESTAQTLISLMPIVDGLRPYTPEVVNGVISGLGSRAAGYFDANGHFARIQFNQPPNAITGVFNNGEGVGGFETGQGFRCPGGAQEPAPDNSNPYIDDPDQCDPADDIGGGAG
jgi:phospholipid/cholesterol/gamma-HCH transport system substrate-binding protein